MATTYNNVGPVYLTQAKYNALVTAGTVEVGREYVIVDSTEPLTKSCPTTTDGTFVLKCTVASGVATYSWVAEA